VLKTTLRERKKGCDDGMISSCFFLIENGSLPFCVDAEVEYEYN
jgi:hypothetical protein